MTEDDIEVTIVDVPDYKVLGMKKTGKYQQIAEMLPALFQHAFSGGIQVLGPAIFVCHETTPEEAKRAAKEGNALVECVIPIMGDAEPGEGMEVYDLPGGKMAKAVHRGPYEQCEATYMKLFAWLGRNGMCVKGFIRESYLNDPREVPEEEILTEIYVPVE